MDIPNEVGSGVGEGGVLWMPLWPSCSLMLVEWKMGDAMPGLCSPQSYGCLEVARDF